ncbi:hypothetical protein HaLaN_18763 [Haematococcus lacustris]|uniref:Uncharacterized protein n=1 Tax=Haematococcus lacustris TaxID=44745 RepID=A0A699ZHM6_HAELA|nr:hypothetical protein HaLaN_18763 [Haematococcus lacustris]
MVHKELAVQIISCVGGTDAPDHKLVNCWHFRQGQKTIRDRESKGRVRYGLHGHTPRGVEQPPCPSLGPPVEPDQ